ncbi:LTA synthase family protein [Utexia brackfieldae]|uniref:LTA synthase family protein n=1 Tax=Utexia brackfieldae TaxID=3074108 RepID=UPI00370D7994
MWFIRFKQAVAMLFMPWLLAVIIQSAGRLFLLFSYVNSEKMTQYKGDIIDLLLTGLRFDIRTTSIALGSLLVLTLFTLFSRKLTRCWQQLLPVLIVIMLMIITIFTVVNIFYYITYDRHIDVFIFGLIDDDTTAIIKTIWSDYPVIWGLIGFMLCAYLFAKITRWWCRFVLKLPHRQQPTWLGLIAALVVLGLIFVGCRGGLGTFPLRESDAQISRYPVLNMFVPNGLMAMQWAYSGYQMDNQFTLIPVAQSQQAIKTFFGENKPDSVNIFMSKTADNPVAEVKPPHVVLAVMESMGSHLFEFDNPDRDLLGSLRQHWQQDWLFSRFVSEGDGTIDSLNRFFVRSPVDKISQSSAQDALFISNMFKPFKAKGYKIIYITAGNGAWRNLNQFLPQLGVDEFIEQNTLLHEFPEAEVGTWGVPDEYMFKYAEKRLAQADKAGEHVMIMMMSITNHPPYHPPKNHPVFGYTFTPAELVRLKNMDSEDEVRRMFNTFRYSNDQLGNFMSWIKSQPLGQHTLVAATGDHNLRGIGYPNPEEIVLSHSVPFYLYVPTAYQYHTVYDKNRIGSHKDIFPTLYGLALSDTPYYQTGCNLVAEQMTSLWCNVGYNPNVVIDDQGAYDLNNNTFMSWQDEHGLRVKVTDSITPVQQQTLEKWQAWTKLLNWQLIKQIKQPE